MTLLWLADVLRAAGLEVVEHTGWKTHVRPGEWSPRYGVVHATAAPRTQADGVQVRVVRDGRSDLPGPIANATVDRTGRWHVLSAGRCNSTLVGTAGPYAGLGNTCALSTEACNDNVSEPWPEVQYRSYVRGWAAWCRRLGWSADRLVGHKEHTPGRKTDPSFNMVQFRADAAAVLAGEDDTMPTAAEIAAAVWAHPLASPALDVDKPRAAADWLKGGTAAERATDRVGVAVAALRTELAAFAGRDLVDERQVAAELAPMLLAVLTPAAIAAAIPPTVAGQVADELHRRMES